MLSSGKSEAEGRGAGTGLTLTAAAFIFMVLRLFAVSDYNWHTAFAILHTIDLEDAVGLVLGTVMADSLASVLILTLLVPIAVLRLVSGLRAARASVERARAQRRPPERPDRKSV
ncbi:hypothetical protein GTY41_29410, partial [Streptomyces sp. SID685]|uniref:hypothetical protein n=1 Tax=Streptomyces sp. SID685 TaxID=2690322 RepID=UPI001406620A